MNDTQFLERAHANPHDDSPEFLQAVAGNPQRLALVEELKAFDSSLRSVLESVQAPEQLKPSLLDIPGRAGAAANDSFWRRNIRYAAVLVVAVGVLAIVMPGDASSLEDVVFRHLYSELSFLDDDTPIALAEVNAIMNTRVGSMFYDSAEMEGLTINHTQDCWVDFENGVRGVHMVVKGNNGPVTVMIIANTPIDQEIPIQDERFSGVITPVRRGNMVVIGEKEESIRQYSTMLAANINW